MIMLFVVGLAMCGVAIGASFVFINMGNSYNVTVTDENYTRIINAGQEITLIANQTTQAFFSNSTRTNQLTSFDRLIGASYGSVLFLGSVPSVFVGILEATASMVGLPVSLTILLLSVVLLLLITAVYRLALGRAP